MYTSKNTSLNIKQKSNSKIKMCRMLNLQNFFDKIKDKYELEQLIKHLFY